ncbi:MAG: hypothetical protein M1528_03240 [Candidatus Marsarchaeota archaeon]|nr:hypothetical protein [Candidatus Marsarchaeota archaeon]MCL5115521.1 hypothetical protein [Candidatus Marsarchaeota archaeon]
MIYVIGAILGVLAMLSALLVFYFKKISHIAVAISALFFMNSLLFLALNQPILAVIQLFIMVGGISTYLFIGVGSAPYSGFKHVNWPVLAISSIAIFALIFYGLQESGGLSSLSASALPGSYSANAIAGSFSSAPSLLAIYAIMIMLFGIGIGAIKLLKRLSVI